MYCPQRVIFFLRQCQELPPPACKILFLRSRPHCNCATSLPRPQYGTPNLTDNFGYLGELDIYDAYDKRGVAVPTGNQARNECYYQLMKSPGVTGAGKNVRAPEYARKAARAVFDYDSTKAMPKNHFDAYMGGDAPDVDEIRGVIGLPVERS